MGARARSCGEAGEPSREEVVAELLLFIRETVRELGEQRATGFLKKFYGWYLGHGRFPKPFKQELVPLAHDAEVELRLLAAAPAPRSSLEQLEAGRARRRGTARAADLALRRRLGRSAASARSRRAALVSRRPSRRGFASQTSRSPCSVSSGSTR